MRIKLLILILIISQISIKAQITASDMVANMGRGINLGNTLSAPVEGNWAPAVQEVYFDDIASAGFKTVRIPADFFGARTSGSTLSYSKAVNTANQYNGSASDYIVSSAYLDRIEEVLTWGLERNLIIILDFHGNDLKDEFLHTFKESKYPTLYTHPTSAKRAADNDKFNSIWNQIATRLKDYSHNLLFEVVNEPYFTVSEAEMDMLNTTIISTIRATGSNNTDRNIVITGGGQNSYEAPLQIDSSVINSDNNLIATFHYYWPRAFTASASSQHTDYDWGTAADKLEIDTNFGAVQSWSQTNNIPILLGEFGADNTLGKDYNTAYPYTNGANGGPENASRVEYHRYLGQKAIDLGFAFTAWDAGHKSGKSIYLVEPNRTWVSDVRNALLGVDCITSGMIKNADIECGTSIDWDLVVPTGTGEAIATIETETSDVYTAQNALKINVTTAGSTHNKVVFKNQPYTVDISGETVTFRTFAKATNAIEIQNFKFQIKIKDNLGNTSNFTSSAFNLTTNYELYQQEYTIPANTTELEFKILCGKKAGTYYFDDFSVLKNEAQNTLNINNVDLVDNLTNVVVYPNPAKNKVFVKNTKQIVDIQLFNLTGVQLNCILNENNTIDVSHVNNGYYILKMNFNNGTSQSTKLIINK